MSNCLSRRSVVEECKGARCRNHWRRWHSSAMPVGSLRVLCFCSALFSLVFYILWCALSAVICGSQLKHSAADKAPLPTSYHFLFRIVIKSMIWKPGASKSRFSGSAPIPKSYHSPCRIFIKTMILRPGVSKSRFSSSAFFPKNMFFFLES